MEALDYLAARAMAACPQIFRPEDDAQLAELLGEWRALKKKERAALDASVSALRFALLTDGYFTGRGRAAAAVALGLAVACAMSEAADKAFQRAAGGPLDMLAAWRLAHGESVWAHPDEADEACRWLRYLMPGAVPAKLEDPLAADDRLLGYLAGGETPDALLDGVAEWASESRRPLLVRRESEAQLCEAFEACQEGESVLHLAGGAGEGKLFLLARAAARAQTPLLAVDCRILAANSLENIWRIMDAVRREALFYAGAVCLRRADAFARRAQPDAAADDWQRRLWHLCVQPLLDAEVPVCICTDGPAGFLHCADRPVRRIAFEPCTRAEQIALWQGMAEAFGVQLDAVQCASKYRLSPRQIETAVRQLAAECPAPVPADIARVCAQVLPPPEGGVRSVRAAYTLDDLKLPARPKQQLLNIAAHVLYRHKVYDEWNMESRYAYGRCVSALFVGPPGTGKTMAVHVLSGMLELPVYAIDLSQVVDKYIGETEKRLEKIFDAAEKSNVILFFDEADSIFGKRSEVNDAKDKYANTEVSYILQRIEQYDGIVILATNYKRNIDEAFMRRMRYLVEFQMPSQELREQIWRASFAPETPLADVDFAYLARQFELSGGSIKNVALNAVFQAAQEDTAVAMRHILVSLRDENLKMGKPMLPQDFAEYAALMR